MSSGVPERNRPSVAERKKPAMPERKRLSMKDVLLWAEGEPPKPGPRRIGIHTSTAGGVEMAAERAYRLGANTFQVFSDRKSTRLNSSHSQISYAVFCLKKKNKDRQ